MKPERIIKHCSLCGKKTIKGKDLEFISSIIRDGSGTVDTSNEDMSHLDNTSFSLNSLSITNKTYIASEFNSYVVRLKK
jgi:prenyltransferase beta subunit